MSEKVIIILVVALVLVVFVLVGVILFLFKELMKEKDMTQNSEHSTEPSRGHHNNSTTPMVDQLRSQKKGELFNDQVAYCMNHPQDNAKGLCAICGEGFCEECLREHEGLTFCGPHFRLFLGHEWVEIETIKTTPDTPESAFPIYDFKRELWEKEGLPAIVSTHYKINIESDTIESFVKLLVRSNEEQTLKDRFTRYRH